MATIIEASPVAKGPRLGLFNHTALRTRSPEQSRKFYSQLGLVEIAEFNFDTLTVWLLGGPDTATETLTLRTGLLEIVYPHRDSTKDSQESETTPDGGSGLVKLCFTVPNLESFLISIASDTVKVLKRAGEDGDNSLIAARLGIRYTEDLTDNKTLWDMIKSVALVLDPDGHLIELIEQA